MRGLGAVLVAASLLAPTLGPLGPSRPGLPSSGVACPLPEELPLVFLQCIC